MTTATRTSGVAPLAVFFDAVDGTTPSWQSGVVQPSGGRYASLHYEWDFGDTASGTWTTTGKSRNLATGYTAAHVFESPGTYVVALKVTDPTTSSVSTYQQTITVSAFSGTTYYVDATGGNDSNDGLSTTSAWRTVAKAFASGVRSNSRVLFKRGESFTSTGSTVVTAAGPGILGAYGTGDKPVINVTGATGGIEVFAADWRLMDLEIRGNGDATGSAVQTDRRRDDNLWLRVTFRNLRVAMSWYYSADTARDPNRGTCICECVARGIGLNGMFIGGRQMAVLGTDITGITQSHVLRIWQMYKGVVSNCILRDPGATRHSLKLHSEPDAYIPGVGALLTQYVTVNDNVIRGTGWAVTVGPQNNSTDERVSHVVFERNLCESYADKGVDVVATARHLTIRNNVFLGTASAPDYQAVLIATRGIEPSPQFVDVYNNTVYRADGGSEVSVVEMDSTPSDVNVRNNLVSAPQVGSTTAVQGTCPRLVVSHNLVTDTPGFQNAAGGDFRLASTSAAVNAGTPLAEVFEDMDRRLRSGAPDAGAFER
jgi:hypothetical protein